MLANIAEQDSVTLEHNDLRRIPSLYPGERQLPTGHIFVQPFALENFSHIPNKEFSLSPLTLKTRDYCGF